MRYAMGLASGDVLIFLDKTTLKHPSKRISWFEIWSGTHLFTLMPIRYKTVCKSQGSGALNDCHHPAAGCQHVHRERSRLAVEAMCHVPSLR